MVIIKNYLKDWGIFLYYCVVRDVTVEKTNEELERIIREVEEKYKDEDPDRLKENKIVRAYRDFYWKIGIDPTKTRPSSEALRRRVIRGSKLPRINNIVDIGNLISVDYLIPIGIYDLNKIKGNLSLILSKGGELFYPIGGKEEIIDKDLPILVDREGKVLHLFPHRDSRLTMITLTTKNVIVVASGVPGVEKDLVYEATKQCCSMIEKYSKGVSDKVVIEA